jgi:hypothetical protein
LTFGELAAFKNTAKCVVDNAFDAFATSNSLANQFRLPVPKSQNLLPLNQVPNAGGNIISYVTKEEELFYRVYSGNNSVGSYLVKTLPNKRYSAIKGLALPPGNKADFFQEVIVPAGTRIQRSKALPAFGQPGGLEQYQLLEIIPTKSFGPGARLK